MWLNLLNHYHDTRRNEEEANSDNNDQSADEDENMTVDLQDKAGKQLFSSNYHHEKAKYISGVSSQSESSRISVERKKHSKRRKKRHPMIPRYWCPGLLIVPIPEIRKDHQDDRATETNLSVCYSIPYRCYLYIITHVDIAFWASIFYLFGSIFYLVDSFCYLQSVSCPAAYYPVYILFDDDGNPLAPATYLNTIAAVLFLINALLCIWDWQQQITQISTLNLSISTLRDNLNMEQERKDSDSFLPRHSEMSVEDRNLAPRSSLENRINSRPSLDLKNTVDRGDFFRQSKESASSASDLLQDTTIKIEVSDIPMKITTYYFWNNLFFLGAALVYTVQAMWWEDPKTDIFRCGSYEM
jgi:hypothetical protein